MSTSLPPRRRRRWPWILLALVIGLPALAFGAALLLLDAEALRPRLVAAVERATGRTFTVGEMRLAISLVPTVELRDVALANAEGASRPNMLTASRVQVQAALLPLLSREIRISRIELEDPDLLLEVDAQGRGNWQFTRTPSAATPAAPAPEEAVREALALGIDALRLERGRIGWRDARSGMAETAEITQLDATAPLGGGMTAEGEVVLRGQAVAVRAETGGLASFGGAEPWPVTATLGIAGAEARVAGTLTGQAWTGTAEAQVPDLSRLSALVQGATLPPLRAVVASAAASGTGGAVSEIRDLKLAVGESDLATLRPGLVLRRAELAAPGLEAPITLAGEVVLDGQALRLSGTAGTPALLLAGASGPLPLDLRAEGAGITATAAGRIAQPRELRGIALAITAQAADLAPFGLRGEGRFSGQVAMPGPGMAGGVRITGLNAAVPAAEVRGDLALAAGARTALSGTLAFPRLDLDALLAATRPAAAPSAVPSAAPAAPAAPAAAPAAADNRVIPATPLPVAMLRGFDADLRLSAPSVTYGGQAWRQVSARLALAGGNARLAPVSVETPAGPLTLELQADARQDPPRLRVAARSPGLDLAALSRAAGRDPLLLGRAQIDADLAGRGADLRAVAATAAGHLGIALVDGAVPRSLLRALPQQVLGAVIPGGDGDIPLRCFALRAPAAEGQLRLETLYAEGALGRLGGSGVIDMGEETLAVRLLTDLRTARIALRAPVNIGGRWNAPRVGVEPAAAAAAGLGAFLSQQNTPDRSLQALADMLGGAANRGGEPAAHGSCEPALAAARGGVAGPAPTVAGAPAAPAPQAAPAGGEARPNPADLLRGLLGR
ncbi:AsmA family protein [Falsiroseomonas sp. E2-1-a4]|uniref:AsmA family protein n=1 Tax=Falsiroseomonas sp. E2-1-a4 TaxID=3239299 RepID=UPI003F364535